MVVNGVVKNGVIHNGPVSPGFRGGKNSQKGYEPIDYDESRINYMNRPITYSQKHTANHWFHGRARKNGDNFEKNVKAHVRLNFIVKNSQLNFKTNI